MNDTEAHEDEIPNNDESFDPSGDAKQCIVQHEILHLSVDATYGTGTEEDNRRDKPSRDVDNENDRNERNNEDAEEERTANSRVSSQSSNPQTLSAISGTVGTLQSRLFPGLHGCLVFAR
jgi:hypothetical protein